jgi:MFS family permease
MLFSRNYRHQLFATLFGECLIEVLGDNQDNLMLISSFSTANLTTFAYGIAIGWPSPNLPRLLTEDTPLANKQVLTLDEVSWVGSIYLFGGCVSSLIFGWTAEKFGRKVTIIGAALPQAISWLVVEYGTNFNHLFLARLLVGLGGGGCFVTIPMYVSKLASEQYVPHSSTKVPKFNKSLPGSVVRWAQ